MRYTTPATLLFKATQCSVLLCSALLLSACGGGGAEPSATEVNNSPEPAPVENSAPIADAGLNQQVTTGEDVQLSAQLSSDLDGDSLSYLWRFTSQPAGSNAYLSDATLSNPHFTADVSGTYTLSLVVSDGVAESVQDLVTITSSSTRPAAISYAIVDTNQTTCYDSNSGSQVNCADQGYDADYSGHQPSYTLSGDGLTVTDNVTQLVWLQSTETDGVSGINANDKLTLDEAISYCSSLSQAGRDDWRLPSIKELYSLIQFSGQDPSGYTGTDTTTLKPFIDPIFDRAFGDLDAGERIIDGQYASSTRYVSSTMNGDPTLFGVNFVDGRIKGYPISLPSGASKSYYVRCVAGNTQYGQNAFVDNGDETISDQATALMWQQSDYQSSHWNDAIAYCEAATTADHDDWRLPNAKELHSLVDYSRSPDTHASAAIDPIFTATSFTNEEGEEDWSAYWSSSTHVTHTGKGNSAATVSFGRALGYMAPTILDVHGAGAQRSDDKLTESGDSANLGYGTFYYKGPQGDIRRVDNRVRCVRDIEPVQTQSIATDGSVNILLIVGDDIGVDNVSGYGEHPDSAQTPTLDSLIKSGALFRNTWANAMCSPSRASLLTGRHPFRHGVTHPGGLATGALKSSEQTIAKVLSDAGYQTALFGKWHLGSKEGYLPTDHGFDYFSGSLANLAEEGSNTGYFNWVKTQITAPNSSKTTIAEKGYASEVVASEASEWIARATGPWFVEVAFQAPHAPFHVPPKDKFSGIALDGEQGELCTSSNADDDREDCYRAMAEAMDTYIGELLASLNAETLANTLIIFLGDNGTTPEGVINHGAFSKRHSKGTVYEGGVNVPLIISGGSNVPVATTEVDDLIQIQDLFPTLMEIGNGSSSALLDGQSLLGYLDATKTEPTGHTTLFTELDNGADVTLWAISNGAAKYMNNGGTEECYHLSQDPAESTNYWDTSGEIASTCNTLKAMKPF